MKTLKSISHVRRAALALGFVLFPLGLLSADEPGQPPANEGAAAQNAEAILRDLASRSASWTAPPATLENLEYDFVSGSEVTRVRVKRGEQWRHSVWMGATLHAGFQSLVQFPEKYTITVTRQPDARTVTLTAKLKNEKDYISVEVGNGVENSWHGYYSHGARETSIVVDAERLVPIEEQTGATHVRYSDWQGIGKGKWVPRRIDVTGLSEHYRMHFEWLGNAVWLLRNSEFVTPEATLTTTRTRNVIANGRQVSAPITDDQQRVHEDAQVLVTMLDHNKFWLDGGAADAGLRPPFRTLSYSFHTVREDIRETAVLDRGGEAVFEIAHDGQGKMKGQVGDRQIALNTREYGLSKQGSRFAWIYGRSDRVRTEPFDLNLQRCGRIGCRIDLPLFQYHELLDSAAVAVKEGTWEGRRSQVASVTLPGGSTRLGCGTMLAFTSWSYLHDILPSKEVITIDAERQVPVHETLTSTWQGKIFEIDFADYVEVEPGQWSPLSIRIESKDYFTCHYQFQLVAGKHWMLKEMVSWFKPEEKSRGVIEDVRIDGDRAPLDDALRQVQATRQLFGGDHQPELSANVATVPFVLGLPMQLGPYEIRVAMQDRGSVGVTASTADRNAPGAVPVGFLDAKGRLFFAPTITLTDDGGIRRGSATVRGTHRWQEVRSIVVPRSDPAAKRQPVRVVPLRWGEPVAVNIPDAPPGGIASRGEKEPRKSLTRAFQVKADRSSDGTAKLTLDVVSIDGPHEFYFDLSAVILGRSGEVLASGGLSTSLHVESRPVEERYEIPMGKIHDGVAPAFVAIGLTPGNVTGGPMGSLWGLYLNSTAAFDVATLLAAPDEESRRTGLLAMTWRRTDRVILSEFIADRFDKRSAGKGPNPRQELLRPLAATFARIAREPGAADVRARAARYLAYSEAEGAADTLRPLAEDSDLQVREAAAIGLTFLGQTGYLESLRAIVNRTAIEKEDAPRSSLFRLLEQDPLIALAHQRSDAAVDILGARLLGDLKGLQVVQVGTPQERLEGSVDQATQICKLLGRTANSRAVLWLASADDLIAGRPDLAKHFPRHELAHAMLSYLDQTKDRIREELETGDAADIWANTLDRTHDSDFFEAIHTMLRRQDVNDGARRAAVEYLWNLGSPQAIDALRETYDRKLMKGEEASWLRLCEALAASGDGRGLPDAFDVLLDLERPAQPPLDEQKRRSWESDRNFRKDRTEAVFQRASKELITGFLSGKTKVTSSAEQEVVLRLLWRLPDLPKSFAPVLPAWTASPDMKVAEMARRLVERK